MNKRSPLHLSFPLLKQLQSGWKARLSQSPAEEGSNLFARLIIVAVMETSAQTSSALENFERNRTGIVGSLSEQLERSSESLLGLQLRGSDVEVGEEPTPPARCWRTRGRSGSM